MTPVGWSLGSRTVGAMLGLYPKSSAVRVFYEPGKGLPAAAWSDPRSPLAQLPPGCTAVVSHKDQNVDSLAFVEAWQQNRPDVDLDLIRHHEPEQQTGGDPTPAQFRSSWTQQRQQVGGHPARAAGRLRLDVCYTLQWIRGGGDWRMWYPEHEADAVDRVLFDWYPYEPGAPKPFRPRTYEDPASAIAPMTEIAAATGKPWGIAEINHLRIAKANGFAVDLDVDGSMCAAWYRRMFAAAKAAGCQVWCHYHRGGGDLTGRLPEQQALRDLIEQEATMGRWTDIAKWVGPTPNQGGAMRRHDGVVIHIAEGSYDGTIAWQRNPSADVSSHFIVAKDGRIAQMVDTNVTAWTQRDGNGEWLSIENEGRLPDALTADQVEANARILAKAHQVYGVPLQVTDTPAKRGLGHHSMGAESGYNWGHPSCPGAAIKAQKAAIVARAKQIINGEDDDMQLTDTVKVINDDKVQHSSSTLTVEGILAQTNYYAILTRNLQLAQRGEIAALRATVDQLTATLGKVVQAGGGSFDQAAMLTQLDERLAAVRADLRDAVADLGEGGAEQVRGPQS